MSDGLPDFSGAWVADLDRSVFRMAKPAQLFMRIEHRDQDILHRIRTVLPDGTERLAEVRYRIGVEVQVEIGGAPARVIARWSDRVLIVESRIGPTDQEVRLADHWSRTTGDELIMAHPDDILAGQVCRLRRATAAEAVQV